MSEVRETDAASGLRFETEVASTEVLTRWVELASVSSVPFHRRAEKRSLPTRSGFIVRWTERECAEVGHR